MDHLASSAIHGPYAPIIFICEIFIVDLRFITVVEQDTELAAATISERLDQYLDVLFTLVVFEDLNRLFQ